MSIETPGVYIQEISKFPPSVASVETAIPAFIGYTEKAKLKEDRDLIDKPTRISSMLEYEAYFGFAELETSIVATVVDSLINGNSTREIKVSPPSSPSPFLMYYSMQMYFANGGGPCYIVSVDTYENAKENNGLDVIHLGDSSQGIVGLIDGLKSIEKQDEPTLLLFPDASSLNSKDDFYSLYQLALNQCNKLMDRFTIIDTYKGTLENEMANDVLALRNGISDNTKYGASYYPFLETVLNYSFDEDKIIVTGLDAGLAGEAELALNAINTIDLIALLDRLVQVKTDISALAADDDYVLLKNEALKIVKSLVEYYSALVENINGLLVRAKAGGIDFEPEVRALDTWMDGNLEPLLANLLSKQSKLRQDDTKAKLGNTLGGITVDILVVDEANTTLSISVINIDGLTADDGLFDKLKVKIDTTAVTPVTKLSDIKDSENTVYNIIKSEINKLPVILPPSSTMAGVYARVDNNRGVWKAPANVGVNYVIKPSVHISHDEQSSLNLHTTGKSINAIRSFIGKGTLVWGARTLAGNDNEWRYVPVRRFFNFVEESVKKATEQFVFEPNDKNTWVKVQAMINNFLTLQWKAGALAGPTPDKAFYVKIGLNETMTAQDVLEGRLIVEIGMAAVRPAEFIILRFSHQLQEA